MLNYRLTALRGFGVRPGRTAPFSVSVTSTATAERVALSSFVTANPEGFCVAELDFYLVSEDRLET
jgi:hypothetical protein